jgi:hypothetical protein
MDKKMSNDSQFPEDELARLADGSLPPARGAALREEVQRSPDLARALAEQEQALSLVRAADVSAPDSLRQWLDEQTHQQAQRVRGRQPQRRSLRWRPRIVIPAMAGALAAAAAVVVIGVGGGSSPTLGQATEAALAPATMPAPTEASNGATTVDVSAAGIPFPYWGKTVGWSTTGARIDSLAGRRAVTVFYTEPRGLRVGYTIVTGPPVPVHGGLTVTQHGIPFTFKRLGSARLVTWLRSGHTCVIAGRGITNQELLKLATADVPA